MTAVTELWVDRSDLRRTKFVERNVTDLAPGQVLFEIEKFGLTANNVTYAVTGDMIGYWKYYPAEDEWGKVPVWGFATAIQSNDEAISVGERIWGFFPMATHAVLETGRVNEQRIIDTAAHRAELPAMYNGYNRTSADSDFLQALETERCLLFPLFATSFVLCDYLIGNEFFGADQVLVGSASSKTGFGLAKMLTRNPEVKAKTVGLTSAKNIDFVISLNCCDEVVAYDDVTKLDPSVKSAFVDMSGNGPVRTALHHHFGENLVESCAVGATHWEAEKQSTKDLPGAKPTFFFAPSWIQQRDKDWGRGVVMQKAYAEAAEVAAELKGIVEVTAFSEPARVEQAWLDLVDNKVPASTGLLLGLKP